MANVRINFVTVSSDTQICLVPNNHANSSRMTAKWLQSLNDSVELLIKPRGDQHEK